MPSQTLMIQMKDKRKYYTEPSNLPMLVEFAKTFGAELTLVESPGVDTMDLERLAPALCDDAYKSPRLGRNIRVVHKLYPIEEKRVRTRQEMLQNAKDIREHIRLTLETNGAIRAADVKEKFYDLELTDSCMSNHVAVVIKDMKKHGIHVKSADQRGSYTITNRSASV